MSIDLARYIIVDFMPCKLCRGFAYAKIFMAALMEDVHLFVEGKGMIVLPSIPLDQWFQPLPKLNMNNDEWRYQWNH